MTAFDAYARYYDLLYRDKDYAAEARYVHGLIQQYSPGAKTILDLGCGTGAHAAEFANLGFEVHGVDSSESMLTSARTRREQLSPDAAAKLSFSKDDTRRYRAGRRFDVVTALFHVVSYQVTNEDLARTFTTAADHLAAGGVFIFDCWYGPAVLSDPPVIREKRIEDANTLVLRTAKPEMHINENVVEVNYVMQVTDLATGQRQEIREQHLMRYLFAPEMLQLLQTVRLTPVHFSQWMSDAAASQQTWNVVMAAQAQAAGGQ